MVFSPGQDQFRAATRLCICELCKSAFGSCHQFSNYTLSIAEKNKVYLRSNNAKPDQDEEDETDITDFVAAGSLVAVAADTKSIDTVWFVRVLENGCIGKDNDCDDYGNSIPFGTSFIKGNFLELSDEKTHHRLYTVSKKITYFYKECVLYPFVNMSDTKKGFILKTTDYMDVIQFVEANNFCHL